MISHWKKLSYQQKWLRGCQILLSLIVIVAAGLQLGGLWPDAGLLTTPALGFLLLLQTAADWKTNRVTAVFGLLAAISVFVMFGIGVFLK